VRACATCDASIEGPSSTFTVQVHRADFQINQLVRRTIVEKKYNEPLKDCGDWTFEQDPK
jgi:hypothetical protein